MIPELVIEKAKQAGWRDRKILKTAKGEELYVGMFYEEIALDPTFWQALGKSLRGEVKTHTYTKRVHAGKPELGSVTITRPNRYSFNWLKHAHRFYNLILQGKETDDFWKQLLT